MAAVYVPEMKEWLEVKRKYIYTEQFRSRVLSLRYPKGRPSDKGLGVNILFVR